MPDKSDIINAVKYLDIFLKVNELKGAILKKNNNGQPFFFTGGFNMVFLLEKKSIKWAFRVWHTNIKNKKERFQKISKYLIQNKLPYFADFIYDEKGLLVNGEYVDTIRMEWIEGNLLKEYLEQNLKNKQKLLKFAELFLDMCKELHKYKISHGDLQHGNIIIDKNDKIKLIDYDSICVPDIEGQEEFISGLKGYQHPLRMNQKNNASLKADYFSELIIYLSILAIAEKPDLANKYQILDSESLLFDSKDFIDLQKSEIYSDLQSLGGLNPRLLLILEYYLSLKSINDLEPFYELISQNRRLTLPKIKNFSASKKDVYENELSILTWEVAEADFCYLSEVGDVSNVSFIELSITRNDYTLTAINSLGKVEKTITLSVNKKPNRKHPAFKIASLLVLLSSTLIILYKIYNVSPPPIVSSIDKNDLIGYYSVEQTLGNNRQSASAQILETSGNLSLLIKITNFPPKIVPLKVDLSKLTLSADLLGIGEIIYHENFNEVEIIFKKDSNIWVLRK